MDDYLPRTFLMSRRGKPQLSYRGYLFNSDGVKNGRVYWRCSETRRGTCMARVLTTENSLLERQPTHDHLPNKARVDGKKTLSASECYQYFSALNRNPMSATKMKKDIVS